MPLPTLDLLLNRPLFGKKLHHVRRQRARARDMVYVSMEFHSQVLHVGKTFVIGHREGISLSSEDVK